MAENITTVLDKTEITADNVNENDVMYLIHGTGPERDKFIKISELRNKMDNPEKFQIKTIHVAGQTNEVDLDEWPYNAVICVHKSMNNDTPVYPESLTVNIGNTTGAIFVLPELPSGSTMTVSAYGDGTSEAVTTTLTAGSMAVINAHDVDDHVSCFVRNIQSGDRPVFVNTTSTFFTVVGDTSHNALIYVDSSHNLVITAANNSTLPSVIFDIPDVTFNGNVALESQKTMSLDQVNTDSIVSRTPGGVITIGASSTSVTGINGHLKVGRIDPANSSNPVVLDGFFSATNIPVGLVDITTWQNTDMNDAMKKTEWKIGEVKRFFNSSGTTKSFPMYKSSDATYRDVDFYPYSYRELVCVGYCTDNSVEYAVLMPNGECSTSSQT